MVLVLGITNYYRKRTNEDEWLEDWVRKKQIVFLLDMLLNGRKYACSVPIFGREAISEI